MLARLRLLLISTAIPLFVATADPNLILTRQKVESGSSGTSFWKFSVRNASDHQVTIAIEHKYSYINSAQYRPIFGATISDFRGNKSSEGSFKEISEFNVDQGLVLNPGDSLPLPGLSFHFLPSAISAKFAVLDHKWKEVDVTWNKETEQGAAANP